MPAITELLASADVPMQRVVHGGQAFTYHRPLRPGNVLTGELAVRTNRAFGEHRYLVLRAELQAEGSDEVVLVGEATLIVLAADPASESSQPAAATPAVPAMPLSPAAVPPSDSPVLAPGTVLTGHDFQVTRMDLVRYAAASGDLNPIHWSDRIAHSVGLPGVIAHGMLTMALAGRVVTNAVADPAQLRSFSVRFSKPVPVPDDDAGAVVTVGGGVASATNPDELLLSLSAQCAAAPVLTQARAVVTR